MGEVLKRYRREGKIHWNIINLKKILLLNGFAIIYVHLIYVS